MACITWELRESINEREQTDGLSDFTRPGVGADDRVLRREIEDHPEELGRDGDLCVWPHAAHRFGRFVTFAVPR